MKVSPSVVVASVVGLIMVGCSYVLSQGIEEAATELELKATTKLDTRTFIPVTDQDNDGLPDWQNTFNINTIQLGEGQTNATTTETADLAIELANSAYMTGADSMSINSKIGPEVLRSAVDEQYDREDIIIGIDDSLLSLRTYGNTVAAIAIENAPPTGTESELTVLNSALIRNDPSVLDGLDPTIASYEAMLKDMLETPVPPSLVREHLSLINVYQALINDIKAFRGTFNDALPAMVRFRRYQADAEALYIAITALYAKLDQQGIVWTDADIASKFVKIGS